MEQDNQNGYVVRGRRSSDTGGWRGAICWVARRASEAWDFIDKRDIDKHVAVAITLIISYKITKWGMWYADMSTRPGMEVGAIIAAVGTPWSLVQAAALKWYFETRAIVYPTPPPPVQVVTRTQVN